MLTFQPMGNKSLQARIEEQREKRDALDKKIQLLEAEQRKRDRREQTQRYAILGRVLYELAESQQDGWSQNRIQALVTPHLTRSSERKLFGLESLQEASTRGNNGRDKTPKKPQAKTEQQERSSPGKATAQKGANRSKEKKMSGQKADPLPMSHDQNDLLAEFVGLDT